MGVKDFEEQLKSQFKDDVVVGSQGMNKFSSGCYSLDVALGGGWAFGKFHLIVGGESGGKTTTAIRSAAQMNLINRETGEFDPTYSNPCTVLYIDQEGTFDEIWARKLGFDLNRECNLVASFTAGEQAADTVNSAICSGEFSLIIIDSLETFLPKSRIEGDNASVEDLDVGGRARILNRGYRQWLASMKEVVGKTFDTPWKTPTIIALNQYRETIGITHGDNRVIPGGKSQLFYSSTIVSMNKPKIQDDKSKTWGIGEFHGIVKKNKTGCPPKRNFSFEMALRDLEELKSGEIDNAGSIFKDAKQLDMIQKLEGSKGYEFLGETYRVQGDIKDKLSTDPVFLNRVWTIIAEKQKT